MAKFDPFLSLDCARVEGSNFAIWQPWSQMVFGKQGSNNAGEYLAVDYTSGELMVFVDSDALGGGFGFMKLSPI